MIYAFLESHRNKFLLKNKLIWNKLLVRFYLSDERKPVAIFKDFEDHLHPNCSQTVLRENI